MYKETVLTTTNTTPREAPKDSFPILELSEHDTGDFIHRTKTPNAAVFPSPREILQRLAQVDLAPCCEVCSKQQPNFLQIMDIRDEIQDSDNVMKLYVTNRYEDIASYYFF